MNQDVGVDPNSVGPIKRVTDGIDPNTVGPIKRVQQGGVDPNSVGPIKLVPAKQPAVQPQPTTTPHTYDRYIDASSKKHGVDAKIIQQLGLQETMLGTGPNYDPKTGRDRDSNKGVGPWQVDPSSGTPKAVLDRIAKDPAFAADYVGGMIKNALAAENGDQRRAFARYHGGPQWEKNSAANLAYADQVLSRLPAGLQIGADPKTVGKITKVATKRQSTIGDPSVAINPMDTVTGTQAGDQVASTDPYEGTQAGGAQPHSWLNQIAGHQDLPFILNNAAYRDLVRTQTHPSQAMGLITDDPFGLIQKFSKDPHSEVSKAMNLYRHDPAGAMDEYGLGSPNQSHFMHQHDPHGAYGALADFQLKHPRLTGVGTFLGEMANPMANVEGYVTGELGGVALNLMVRTPLGRAVGNAIGKAATRLGMGSALSEISKRGGKEAQYWAQGLIYRLKGESNEARNHMTQFFGGLKKGDEQNEVVRLSQGLKPNPHIDPARAKIIADRANKLRQDIKDVTQKRLKRGLLRPEDEYNSNRFFPMSNSYDFGPQYELEKELTSGSRGAAPNVRPKTFDNLDQSIGSGLLDKDFSPAANYENWRRQVMQHYRFDEHMERAPESLRKDLSEADYAHGSGKPMARPWTSRATQSQADAVKQKVAESQGHYPPGHPERLERADRPDYVAAHHIMPSGKSPILDKSVVAPELVRFFQNSSGFQRYVSSGGTNLPGEAQTSFGKFLGLFRAAIVANPWFHVGWNVGGNEAAARGVHGLGGPMYEVGGAAYNLSKALALQLGLAKPQQFIKGAQSYAQWLDKALSAGGIAEFDAPRTTAFGQDYVRTMSVEAPKLLSKEGQTATAWINRIDRALTGASDVNRVRTFGSKGEEAFAVSLFKDAVEKGKMADHEAAALVRETLGNYLDFDPKSWVNGVMFFMPWLKSNSKFWLNTLVRKPQYLTAPAHAIRNINIGRGDPALQGKYAPPDYRAYQKDDEQGRPEYYTPPLPQRIVPEALDVALGEPGSNDVGSREYALQHVLQSRATPPTTAVIDTLLTAANRSADPNLDPTAMYAPMAPAKMQLRQYATSLAQQIVPVPLAGFVVRDIIRRGWQKDDLANLMYATAGVGYGATGLNPDDRRSLGKIRSHWERQYSKDLKENEGDPEGLQSALQDDYQDFVDKLRDGGFVK